MTMHTLRSSGASSLTLGFLAAVLLFFVSTAPAHALTFTASLSVTSPTGTNTISQGQSVQLTWGASGSPVMCTGTNFDTGGATSGTVTVTPPVGSTQYRVDCQDNLDRNAFATQTITVTAVASPVAIISASPSTITRGANVSLSYECDNSSSGTISGIGSITADGATHFITVAPTSSTSYVLTCYGTSGGSAQQTATVTVNAPAPTASLSASPSSITQSSSSALTYRCTDSTSGSISGVGSITADGNYHTISVTPSNTTTYVLTCIGTSTAQASATVTVTLPTSLTVACSVSPTSINAGSSATWTASVSNGTPPYTYTWAGDDGLAGRTGQSATVAYPTAGTKNGSVRVTDSTTVAGTTYVPVYNSGGGLDTGGYQCSGPVLSGYGWNDIEDYDVLGGGYTNQNGGPGYYLNGADGGGTRPSDFPTNTNYCVQVTIRETPCNGVPGCVPNASINAVWHSGSGLTASGNPTNTWYGSETFTAGTSGGSQPLTGTASCSNSLTVAALTPDLTAGATSVSPASPTTSDSLTFTSTASNIGNGTASNFPNVFQIANGALTATVAVDAANTIGSLAPSASTGISGTNPALAAGVYQVRACSNFNTSWGGSISESNSSNNCGAWTTFTVSAPLAPDLTAGNASVITGTTVNTPVTLSAPISNIGTATATNVPNLLFILDSGGHGLQYLSATPTVTLAPNGSATVTATYSTGLPAGNYYAWSCANYSSAWIIGVSESNVNNNCGSYVPFTVSAPAPSSVSCTPSTSTVAPNTPLTYTATPAGFGGTVNYTWTDANGSPSSQGPSTSSQFTTQYAASGAYAAHVVAVSGAQSASADCSPVTVGNSCGGSAAPNVTATPARVIVGSTTSIAWGGTNVVTSCTITGPGVNTTASAGACTATGSVQTPTINSQSTYCVVCDGNQATKQCTTVNVAPRINEF
jgi:hypothetical protein